MPYCYGYLTCIYCILWVAENVIPQLDGNQYFREPFQCDIIKKKSFHQIFGIVEIPVFPLKSHCPDIRKAIVQHSLISKRYLKPLHEGLLTGHRITMALIYSRNLEI